MRNMQEKVSNSFNTGALNMKMFLLLGGSTQLIPEMHLVDRFASMANL